MDVDEEPNDVSNTCSTESRRQFYITLSVTILVFSILYSASVIFYTSYTMMLDMDNDMNIHVIRPVAIYDNCSDPPIMFNTEPADTFRVMWVNPSYYDQYFHVVGTKHWTILANNTIKILDNLLCTNVVVYLRPRIY